MTRADAMRAGHYHPSIVTTSTGRLSARALNRATLARQLLLERAPLGVVEGVRRVVALQAQEAASPYIALWTRLRDFDPSALDRAFADGSVVKSTLMRVTLHAVVSDDYLGLHTAMQSTLRASRLHDPRFRVAGLTIAEVDALLPEILAYAAEPRMNAEAEAWLDERLGPERGRQVWWAVRTFAPFHHAPNGATWSFGSRPSYRASRGPHERGDPAVARPTLVRRYLEGFGPATVADIGQFALLPRELIRAAVEALGDGLVRYEGPGGVELLDVPGGALPDETVAAPPRLLPMWDSILLAYADRSRVIPPEYRAHVIRRNGDTLPTILVDGQVAGVWRPTPDGIEVTAFEAMPDDVWEGLDAEARSLLRLVAERDPRTYNRYARWWSQLPGGEVRLLGR
jgi:hypothetical protein